MPQPRLRELGLSVGELPTGPLNAITDVPGVMVGQTTVIHDEPRVARTGVTVILPRGGNTYGDLCFAGCHCLNGNGEMTGLPWLIESGLLGSPIAITNTHQVGVVRDALIRHETARNPKASWLLPVVAETYDGFLSDADAHHVTREHVFAALESARGGPVAEGNVGGGTGMICHEFKGGIGTASRVAATTAGPFTVGALVQANYGDRRHLRVDGVPIGRLLETTVVPTPWVTPASSSSIIIVVATDALLLATQCRRLAQRATIGLARVGGIGHNDSGDLFLAFTTGNHVPAKTRAPIDVRMLSDNHITPLFLAVVEAVEEAILNSLCAAETMRGWQGRVAHALPGDRLVELMGAHQVHRSPGSG
jgi:D-aminopeptidase